MEIDTSRFGKISLTEEEVLRFPAGLPGFVGYKRYVIVDHPGGGPFKWLQSVDDPGLAFVIIDPRGFCPEFRLSLPESEVDDLHLHDAGDAAVWVICGMREAPEEITANMAAPIVINRRLRLGKQVIVPDSPHGMRFPILQHMRQAAEANR